MTLPLAPQGDLTLTLARDPYRAISRLAGDLGRDAFRAKVMLSEGVFLTGPDMARRFYEDDMIRRDAAPGFLKHTLFGKGAIQGIDGEEHLRRKALFLRIFNRASVEDLANRLKAGLDELANSRPERIVLQDRMELLLTRIVCDWAGVPLSPDEVETRAHLLSDLFEHAVPVTPRFLRGVMGRRQTDHWASELVGQVRAGDIKTPAGSALDEIASYHPVGRGGPLDRITAGVELLNVLRPVVAVSTYLTYIAHAVATQENALPAARDKPMSLVQEVRRFYPFFPMVAARTATDLQIDGSEVAEGTRVFLDIYGTNRDSRTWDDPHMFRPSRFDGVIPGSHDLIPQGGGDTTTGHRCAGEATTIALMKVFTDWIARSRYTRPGQDLHLQMKQLPPLPRSRMVLEGFAPD